MSIACMHFPDNPLDITLFTVFALGFLIQVFYLFFFYLRTASHRSAPRAIKKQAISVIICARDEAENLKHFLPVVLTQDYPDYEVIVVNDCSEDDSAGLLEEFQKQYPHLRVTTIKKDEKFVHGKKLAMTIGIKAARNEYLLFTDADCVPSGPGWIDTMQKHFRKNIDFVLGYGGYLPGKGLLNKLVRLDTVWIAMQYMGYALAGIPYMGVGRNLAYRKSVFFEHKGFASHAHLQSGDDDLFVNAHARRSNTAVETDPTGHTYSPAAQSLKEWLRQKSRHLTTGPRYRGMTKFLLGLEGGSRILFFTAVILLLIFGEPWYIPAGGFLLRWLLLMIVFKFVMRRLNEKNLLLYSFFFDLIQPLITALLLFFNQIRKKKNKWK